MKLAIIGATGLVGRKILERLAQGFLPYKTLILSASSRSVGMPIQVGGQTHHIVDVAGVQAAKPDIVLFAAGNTVAQAWAPRLVEAGARVIDNSSAFRMDPEYKLIVPEVNGHLLTPSDRLIANPNCSTIQLVMALAPLHQAYGLEKVHVATYQAVTGSGQAGIAQLRAEQTGQQSTYTAYPHTIHENVLPHIDTFTDTGYTREELKLMQEPAKILCLPHLAITATAVRVPTIGGHALAAHVTFQQEVDVETARQYLAQFPGVQVTDDPLQNLYPLPHAAQNRDTVWVGRIRRDLHCTNALALWIVADPLCKGAATNALQVARMVAKDIT